MASPSSPSGRSNNKTRAKSGLSRDQSSGAPCLGYPRGDIALEVALQRLCDPESHMASNAALLLLAWRDRLRAKP